MLFCLTLKFVSILRLLSGVIGLASIISKIQVDFQIFYDRFCLCLTKWFCSCDCLIICDSVGGGGSELVERRLFSLFNFDVLFVQSGKDHWNSTNAPGQIFFRSAEVGQVLDAWYSVDW